MTAQAAKSASLVVREAGRFPSLFSLFYVVVLGVTLAAIYFPLLKGVDKLYSDNIDQARYQLRTSTEVNTQNDTNIWSFIETWDGKLVHVCACDFGYISISSLRM